MPGVKKEPSDDSAQASVVGTQPTAWRDAGVDRPGRFFQLAEQHADSLFLLQLSSTLPFPQRPPRSPDVSAMDVVVGAGGIAGDGATNEPRGATMAAAAGERDVGNGVDEPAASVAGVLDRLPEGLIGKLRIHRSGRTTLMLNGVEFCLLDGSAGSFLQQAVAIDCEPGMPTGRCEVLGNVQERFVAVADVEQLLSAKMAADASLSQPMLE